MRTLELAGLAGAMMLLAFGACRGDEAKEVATRTGVKLELVFSKESYQVGEPIEVTMRYTCTSAEPALVALVANYDRGGRIMEFTFRAVRTDGYIVKDPLKFLLGSMGGLRSTAPLTPQQPYEQKVVLNEWLAFAEPGDYEVTAESSIVMEKDATGWGPSIPLTGAPQRIQIIPPDAEWRLSVLQQAREKLAGSKEEKRAAMRSLRFLVDDRATSMMIDGLNDQATAFDAFCGLGSLANIQAVKAALLQYLDSGSCPSAEASWLFTTLLVQADVVAEKLDPASREEKTQKRRIEIQAQWRNFLANKMAAATKNLPPAQAAAKLVDAIAIGGLNDPTLEQKRLILREMKFMTNEGLMRAPHAIQRTCHDEELIPDLSAVATNQQIDPKIRSAALVQLHLLGVNKFRDLIAEDLMARQPTFDSSAFHTLGAYRTREIGAALQKNAQDDKFEVRLAAASLLRDYGTSVTADEWLRLIAALRARYRFNSPELVEGLALASPGAAMPLLREILNGQIESENDFRPIALTLIARLPEAKNEVRKELGADDSRRLKMLQELLQAAWHEPLPQTLEFYPGNNYRRVVPGNKKLIASYAPELLKLVTDDPSESVRTQAALLLSVLSKVPAQSSGHIVPEQIPEYLPQWQEWARGNGG